MYEDANVCAIDCTQCGDDIVSGDEKCDDGDEGNGLHGYCKVDCSGKGPHCGDGECSIDNEDGDRCPEDCSPVCGNGVPEGPERCDDGNDVDDDACSDTCQRPRHVFVSSVAYTGALPAIDALAGVELADAHCQLLAEQGGRGVISPDVGFRAWLSDDTGAPVSRFDTAYTGYYQLVDGTVVASGGWAGLTGGALASPIDLTEAGQMVVGERVWTNTLASGESAGALSCLGWSSSSGADIGHHGSVALTDAGWTDGEQDPCDAAFHLYCFQDS